MSIGYTELDYLSESRIPPTYSCPNGYVLIDRYCELIPNMSCPPGYTLNNGICMKQSSSNVAQAPSPMAQAPSPMAPAPSPCPAGYKRSVVDQMCYPIV